MAVSLASILKYNASGEQGRYLYSRTMFAIQLATFTIAGGMWPGCSTCRTGVAQPYVRTLPILAYVMKMDDLPMKDRAFSEDGSFDMSIDVEDTSDTDPRVSSSNGMPADEAESRYFGQSENRKVRGLKALVFLVLFLVTFAVCLVIFFLTEAGQQHEFEAS